MVCFSSNCVRDGKPDMMNNITTMVEEDIDMRLKMMERCLVDKQSIS